jgi:hypothetical protein|tara:strand:+ start:106 stop:378 length:273 start_codon:yes stop_codon:yes gene_type:complete
MAKLTTADVEKLQKEGVLNNSTVKSLKEKGLASSRKRGSKPYMKTKTGGWVSPQFYFQGISGAEPSAKMTELKDKIRTLISEYSTSRSGK